jgi:predicted transcriptional regulator
VIQLSSGKHESVTTKHEQILQYIESVKLGGKLSVRKIAQKMSVSEGTAYRALKEAEKKGIVSTKERIGTVRVEKKLRQDADKLSFAEVVEIVDGRVLGGGSGLHKMLHKFVIGAMQETEMIRYIQPGSLLIVGNRNSAHRIALENGAGVLITGGFGTSDEAKLLADELDLPLISCTEDTFTVASMINRELYDRAIKKKMLLVADLLTEQSAAHTLKAGSTRRDWQRLLDQTGFTRFPVIDEWNRVIGVITPKDLEGASADQSLDKLMTRSPITIKAESSVAAAAHMMVAEGIELLPVVDGNRKLVGTLTRRQALEAIQFIERSPENGETFEDIIWSGFEEIRDGESPFRVQGTITPQMTSHLGTVSEGVLTTLMTQTAFRALQAHKKGDLVLENMSTYFIKPVQLESVISIEPSIIEISRKYGKVDVAIISAGAVVAKAMMTAQFMDPS